MSLLVLSIYVLAVARLTRLINADTILDTPRLAIIAKARQARADANDMRAFTNDLPRVEAAQRRAARWGKVVYFLQCPWCVGMWVALLSAIVPVAVLSWPWWAALPIALATSHLVGVCARFADTEEIDVEEDDDD